MWEFKIYFETGQEAIAVGMHQVMRKEDTVITSYRCHVWPCLMGHGPLGVLAELTGKTSGCSRSKGGSMHMYGTQFFGGNGIVGAQVCMLCVGHEKVLSLQFLLLMFNNYKYIL